MNTNRLARARAAQRGLTLIELMISMTIGLIILSALTYVYVGSRGTYRVSESLARVQETGRFALDYIGGDLRMTSFAGCRSRSLSDDDTKGTRLWNITANPTVAYIGAGDGIRGYEAGSGWANATGITHVTGSDVLTIRRAGGMMVPVTAAIDKVNRTIKLAHNEMGIVNGDLVVLANCTHAAMFRVTNSPVKSTAETTLAFATSGAGSDGTQGNVAAIDAMELFSPADRAQIMRFTETSYFVGQNAKGERALYRAAGSAVEELVDGVDDMDIVYGVDTVGPADGIVDVYQRGDAVADWNRVVSVRINLLTTGPVGENVAASAQTFAFRDTNNDGVPDAQTAPDRRLRQVFTTTFALRNRMQ